MVVKELTSIESLVAPSKMQTTMDVNDPFYAQIFDGYAEKKAKNMTNGPTSHWRI